MKTIVFWDHFDPYDLNIVKLDEESYEKFKDFEYKMLEASENAQNGLVLAEWNDEYCWFQSMGVDTEKDLKEIFKKSYREMLKTYGATEGIVVSDESDVYWGIVDDSIDMGDAYIHGNVGCYEKDGGVDIPTAEVAYERFKEFCNESRVDKDSSSAYSVLDMNNKKVLFGNRVTFWDFDDWKECYLEEE